MTLGDLSPRALRLAGTSWLHVGVVLLAAAGAVALAALAAWRPLYGLGAAAAALVLLFLLLLGSRIPRLFLGALAVSLVLYALLGRGIAYLGFRPLYMGEIVLLLAVVTLLITAARMRIGLLHTLIVAFMIWGAVRTVPYISAYGDDALRDGVAWGYALFALAISASVRPLDFHRLTRWYATLIPFFLLWVPVAAFAYVSLSDVLPSVPGAPVPVVVFKGGDMGVHLAGVAAFLLLGLYERGARRRINEVLVWIAWLAAVGIAASINRGGMLAASAGGFAGLFMPSFGRFVKPVVALIVFVVALAVINPQIDIGRERTLSMSQVITNILSVVNVDDAPGSLQGTVEWRQDWWDEILDYTIRGPYFWSGKGFGINLATDDGFQLDPVGESLRAPHNGHIEMLARAGVVGLGLWVLLLFAFAVGMMRAALAARRRGDMFWVRIIAWLFAYWLAAVINASFDVYLQGPHGGIWFWSITGLGLVAMHAATKGDDAAGAEGERLDRDSRDGDDSDARGEVGGELAPKAL